MTSCFWLPSSSPHVRGGASGTERDRGKRSADLGSSALRLRTEREENHVGLAGSLKRDPTGFSDGDIVPPPRFSRFRVTCQKRGPADLSSRAAVAITLDCVCALALWIRLVVSTSGQSSRRLL